MIQEKRRRELLIKSLMVISALVILSFFSTMMQKRTTTYENLKEIDWTRKVGNSKETLILKEDNTFNYYNTTTGDPIDGFEKCTKYELKDKKIVLNCGKTIGLITYGTNNLYLKIDGKITTFDNSSKYNYEVFSVGYIDNTPQVTVIDNYTDFINYLDTYSLKIYDGEGNVKETTTQHIKEFYQEDYFDKKNLAIYYITTNSGGTRISDIITKIDNGTLKLYYKLNTPITGTADMNGFMITVGINKNITKAE